MKHGGGVGAADLTRGYVTRSSTLETLLPSPVSCCLEPPCHRALWHRNTSGQSGVPQGRAGPDKILKLARSGFYISSLCLFSWSSLHYILPELLKEGFYTTNFPSPNYCWASHYWRPVKDPEVRNRAWPHLCRESVLNKCQTEPKGLPPVFLLNQKPCAELLAHKEMSDRSLPTDSWDLFPCLPLLG